MKLVIVDNDRNYLDEIKADLTIAIKGIDIQAISELNERSLKAIIDIMPDLALIDIRAQYDDLETDRSGIELARELSKEHIKAALVSQNPLSDAEFFALIRDNEISGVLPKSLDIETFIECIRQYKHNRVVPNGFVQYSFEPKRDLQDNPHSNHTRIFENDDPRLFWSKVRELLSNDNDPSWPSNEEFEVLFRSLVSPCATSVRLSEISPGKGGSAVLKAKVYFGDGPVRESLAIKFGKRKSINHERIRYDRYVGPLPDGVATQMRWYAETDSLGAIAYSWVNDSIENGDEMGPGNSDGRVTWRRRSNVISPLFSKGLDAWYRVYRKNCKKSQTPKSLLEHYKGEGGIWYKNIESLKSLELPKGNFPSGYAITADIAQWHFLLPGKHNIASIIDPVYWVEQGGGSKLVYNTPSPIHGDLHVRNIFIMPDDSPRLIDFGRTTEGHIFRDFAALECSLRMTCIEESNLIKLMEMEDCLCLTEGLCAYINYRDYDNEKEDSELRKVMQIIAQIRRGAFDATGKGDKESFAKYLFATIMHLLYYAEGNADEIRRREQKRKGIRIWHAHYAAAIAAKRAAELLIQSA